MKTVNLKLHADLFVWQLMLQRKQQQQQELVLPQKLRQRAHSNVLQLVMLQVY